MSPLGQLPHREGGPEVPRPPGGSSELFCEVGGRGRLHSPLTAAPPWPSPLCRLSSVQPSPAGADKPGGQRWASESPWPQRPGHSPFPTLASLPRVLPQPGSCPHQSLCRFPQHRRPCPSAASPCSCPARKVPSQTAVHDFSGPGSTLSSPLKARNSNSVPATPWAAPYVPGLCPAVQNVYDLFGLGGWTDMLDGLGKRLRGGEGQRTGSSWPLGGWKEIPGS